MIPTQVVIPILNEMFYLTSPVIVSDMEFGLRAQSYTFHSPQTSSHCMKTLPLDAGIGWNCCFNDLFRAARTHHILKHIAWW